LSDSVAVLFSTIAQLICFFNRHTFWIKIETYRLLSSFPCPELFQIPPIIPTCVQIIASLFPRAVKPFATHPIQCARIQSFEGLPSLAGLAILDIRTCLVAHIEGAQLQPSVSRFNCTDTPLFAHTHLPLMALLTFGRCLADVNDVVIKGRTRDLRPDLPAPDL
jgi:hypothetical protein